MNIRTALSRVVVSGVLLLTAVPGLALAEDPKAGQATDQQLTEMQKEIDAISKDAIEQLIASNDNAREQYGRAAGHAVFRATKAGLLLTGAGGAGVAVNKETDERTYMRMAAGGAGIGAGLQNYRLVMLFETEDALEKFVDGGWDAAASAQAAAGKAGINKASSFVDGIAIYQTTDKGLMAQADLTGTRFWSSNKLNDM